MVRGGSDFHHGRNNLFYRYLKFYRKEFVTYIHQSCAKPLKISDGTDFDFYESADSDLGFKIRGFGFGFWISKSADSDSDSDLDKTLTR